MKIVIDNKIPFIRGVFEPYAEVVYLPGKETTPEVVADADALITRTRTICNEALLKGSRVRAIATATIGFDHIDTDWVEANGIEWTNAPGCNSGSVMQYVSSVLVTLARRHSLDLTKMTLGVVGAGNVGSKVVRAARALGMNVLVNDPPRAAKEGPEGFCSLEEIVGKADIITLHVPLDGTTRHLFDAARLASLRPDQYLINSSRGPVVDNMALKEVLEAGRIAGAVLDVWEGEPDLDPGLVRLLDLSTPHIAGYSADGKANGTMMSVRWIASRLGIPGLGDWTPSAVPAPGQPSALASADGDPFLFTIDTIGKTDSEILAEALLHTYKVEEDSLRLRSDLASFEKQRGDYPVRREPLAFTVRLAGASPDGRPALAERLRALGFRLA
ncbi:MAG: 4-phosphoerythronate dehydrogenase [Bacteroidales bacterium]|nr:4-phosphoerythronate dehydrogenase [Bacteroidales bacterium]